MSPAPAGRGGPAPERRRLEGHRLSLVPTPIGHLKDITLRALETLREADVVAAEDTRHSLTLLRHHGIDTPLLRLDAHTIAQRAPAVLAAHRHVAFVTDAGTPGISDPGAELLRLALELGVEVTALPGPTAFVPALVLSGLPLHRFAFEGFLPRKGRERRERLAEIARRDHSTAFYEASPRLIGTLEDLVAACGPERAAAVARELSKRFETVERGDLATLLQRFQAQPPRGELVVVVGPAAASAGSGGGLGRSGHSAEDAALALEDAHAMAQRLAGTGLWGKDLRRALEAGGLGREQAYELAVRYGQRPDVG